MNGRNFMGLGVRSTSALAALPHCHCCKRVAAVATTW